MSGSDTEWITLAKEFPAGLDTETDPSDLNDGFTPEAYGMDIEYPGRLVANSAQLSRGIAYTAKQFSVDGNNWTWFFRRLWRANGTNLEYNAPEYQQVILYQDLDGIGFDETASNILVFFPIGSNIFVSNVSGGYIVNGALSFEGDYRHSGIEEQMYVNAQPRACPLDSVAYVSNTDGVYAWDGGRVVEITKLTRTAKSYFADKALRIGEDKRRIIGENPSTNVVNFVYAIQKDKLFAYKEDNTDFRWTSKTVTNKNSEPFAVHKVKFYYDNTTGARGKLKLQSRIDRDWYDEQELNIESEEGEFHTKDAELETQALGTDFTLRLTDLSPHIHISRIDILVEGNTNEETPSQ